METYLEAYIVYRSKIKLVNIMNKKEWHWMGKVSGGIHQYNEGKQIINQGKSPKQMRDSYTMAGISMLCGFLIIVGMVIWNLIKNW